MNLAIHEHEQEKEPELTGLERINRRQDIYKQIKEMIQLIEESILNNELLKADEVVLGMDNLFGEFVSFGSFACQDLSHQPGVDLVNEGEFTHLVDSAVFLIKAEVVHAKASLEIPHRPAASHYSSVRHHLNATLPLSFLRPVTTFYNPRLSLNQHFVIEIPAQGGPAVKHPMSEVREVEVFHVAQRVNVKALSLIAPVADQVVSL